MSSNRDQISNKPSADAGQLQFGDDASSVALRTAWERVLRSLAPRLTGSSDSFLKALAPLSLDGDCVIVSAPSRFAREWVEKRHGEALRSGLQGQLGMDSLVLRFVLATAAPERQPLAPLLPAPDDQSVADAQVEQALLPVPASAQTQLAAIASSPGATQAQAKPERRVKPLPPELSIPLSAKYTFDNFVVGKSNRLAHAGATAVADSPGSVYNPLFLYGAPGLGKTHLMHAIGHSIMERRPETRIAYVSGEAFANGYIAALREKKSDEFRALFRSVDVWLVDDIQTLASMEHTKEEFFHTFNTLHQTGKQVVLSSDRAPRELRLMDERLRSRFESGLIADVAAPDVEMRIAILQQKAELEGLDIPADVLNYMAGLVQSNIRTLEGALIRLMAYSSMSGTAVTKELARDVLGGYFVESRPFRRGKALDADGSGGVAVAETDGGGGSAAPGLRALPLPSTISRLGALQSSAREQFQDIIDTVAAHFTLDPAFLAGDGSASTARRREIAAPRQIAIYLARERTPIPVTELASYFGGVSHSAVSHAHKKMSALLPNDPVLLSAIQAIQRKLEE